MSPRAGGADQALRMHLGQALRTKLATVRQHAVRAGMRAHSEAWLNRAPERAWRSALERSSNIGQSAVNIERLAGRGARSAVRALGEDLNAMDTAACGLAQCARSAGCASRTREVIAERLRQVTCDRMLKQTRERVLRAGWNARDRRAVAMTTAELVQIARGGDTFWTVLRAVPEWVKRAGLREGAGHDADTWILRAAERQAAQAGWTGATPACVQGIHAGARQWRWRSPRPPLLALWACAGEGRLPESDVAWGAMMLAEREVWADIAAGRGAPSPGTVAARAEALEEEAPEALDAMLRNAALEALENSMGSAQEARRALRAVETREGWGEPPPTLVPKESRGIVRGCRWQVLHEGPTRAIGAAHLKRRQGERGNLAERVREHLEAWAGSVHELGKPELWHRRARGGTARGRARARATAVRGAARCEGVACKLDSGAPEQGKLFWIPQTRPDIEETPGREDPQDGKKRTERGPKAKQDTEEHRR